MIAISITLLIHHIANDNSNSNSDDSSKRSSMSNNNKITVCICDVQSGSKRDANNNYCGENSGCAFNCKN